VPQADQLRIFEEAITEAVRRKAAAAAAAAAEGTFRDLLLSLDPPVTASSAWPAVQVLLRRYEGYDEVSKQLTEGRKVQLFKEHVAALAAAEAELEAADNSFRKLLTEAQPAIVATSTWPATKPLIAEDPRYRSVGEERRQQLFQEFTVALAEKEREQQMQAFAAAAITVVRQAQEDAAAAAAAASAGSSGPGGEPLALPQAPGVAGRLPASAGGGSDASSYVSAEVVGSEEGMSAEDLAQLQLLRWEQARLRAEYMKMEAKLREMEVKIMASSRPTSPSEDEVVEQGNGSSSNSSSGGGASMESGGEVALEVVVGEVMEEEDGSRVRSPSPTTTVRGEVIYHFE
jgi:hypothetical protein